MSKIVRTLDRYAARFARLAAVVLWTEAVLVAFWPSLVLIGAFIALALLGILAALTEFFHVAFLAAFVLALTGLLISGGRRFRRPQAEAALRRIEHDSRLSHRPFATLSDRPAGDADEAGLGLWRMHMARRRADIRRLRVSPPHPGLPERDPYALRFAVVILLLLGVFIAGDRAGSLIMAAFAPHFSSKDNAIPLEAWIKPPTYTGLSPILLKIDEKKPIAVPAGSTIEAHVTEGHRTPRLVLGEDHDDFTKLEGGGFVLSHTLSKPGVLSIHQGWGNLAEWRITIVADQPPTVAFTNPPAPGPNAALKVNYNATDDYGVNSVRLNIRIVPSKRHIVADPIAVTLAADQDEKELKGSSIQDLTGHPWAGMKVLAKLVATDAAGQTGESDEMLITLPERNFANAVAHAIVAARKEIILNTAPWREIAAKVAMLTFQPDIFASDLGVFLAMRAASARLINAKSDDEDAVAEIEDLLWNAAVRIEDGDRPDAQKALQAAEDALEKALKDPNTPGPKIEQLMQNLQAAMNRYLDALAKNQQQNDQPPKPSSDANTVDRNDLSDILKNMNQMAQGGARQSAQSMLNNLKNMLDNMQAGTPSPKAPRNTKALQALDKLKDLSERQHDMLVLGKGPGRPEEQDALRRKLGDAMRDLDGAMGEIPQPLSGADRAMRDASRSLQQGKVEAARDQQADAAGNLDQAIQDLSGQLSEQEGQSSREEAYRRDPFGRGNPDSGGVKVPTERQMSRAIQILDELRRRSGEHDRPRSELDYIERLLEQF